MAHDMEISFFADKKSKNFCAGSITERQTRKVTETQKIIKVKVLDQEISQFYLKLG